MQPPTCTAVPDDPHPNPPGIIVIGGSAGISSQNYHRLVDEGFFSVDTPEPVNFSRPAIDVTFDSVADAYADRAMGILLSGASQDGTRGLGRIISRGGTGIVQRPDTADYADMPRSARRPIRGQ